MKVNTYIDHSHKDEHVDIYAQTHNQMVDAIIHAATTVTGIATLCGKENDKTYRFPIEEILYIRSEQRKLFAYTKSHRIHIQARLYQLETKLPDQFIRISKSEIINMHNIRQLSLSPNGMIHIEMKHGDDTYSSRRYLKQLKARLFQ
ncbi:LytTR family transcriptional regulator [Staphylococcus sp. IVB6181]|uniref:LytTR family DNA-binding domain-containing protein n=1 Tax=Staphylococcus sp. IVB6181 TaxID=2929481 RepID=UPI0021D3BA3C|nr:LytTR family DNA-binding domain-containing protein [Staphylococcus sp. IVB6181]UXV35400.1 LytTR family transcriptional regulator [Staphylococcus sp. IVB6181]